VARHVAWGLVRSPGRQYVGDVRFTVTTRPRLWVMLSRAFRMAALVKPEFPG
jgi:hypothetical protein